MPLNKKNQAKPLTNYSRHVRAPITTILPNTDGSDHGLNSFGHMIYVEQSKLVKLATIVEGDPKAPFSIATTTWCRGRHYFILWIAPLYPCSLPYNAEG